MVMTVLEQLNQVFEAMFYGEGVYLGLLLYITLIAGLVLKWRYMATLIFPISIFIGLEYLSRNLVWPSAVMFFTSIFLLGYMIKMFKGR